MGFGGKYPKYFGEEFLKSALEEDLGRSDITILNLEINLFSLGGENYFSDIYRVKVQYEFERSNNNSSPQEIHLILKDMRSGVEEELAKSKETAMYKDVIPEMETILGGKEMLAPKLFKVVKYETEAYLIQDLNALGYELKDRIVGLNEEDCIVVLKKIAKFHAASMVYAERFPEVIDRIKDHFFQDGVENIQLLKDNICGMIESSSEVVRQWKGYESIADKLYGLSKSFHQKSIETCNRTRCRYNVINHGDLWVNNFLIKDDDSVFIDLQLSCYASPAIDVNYFLYTSVPVDLLQRKRYELLRIYFKQFRETLKDIGYKSSRIPDWEDFQYEMRRMEFSGIWILLAIFPLVTLAKNDSKGTDFGTLKDKEAWAVKKKLMFSTRRVEETFRYALDRFNDIGALDC